MFVRVKKIGAYEYLYLVENAREGGRHVQRVIKALGRRDEVEASLVGERPVAPEAGEDDFLLVADARAFGILQEKNVRRIRAIHAGRLEHARKR